MNRVKTISLSPSSHLWLLGDDTPLTQHTDGRGVTALMWKLCAHERQHSSFISKKIYYNNITLCQPPPQSAHCSSESSQHLKGPMSPSSFHTKALRTSRVQLSASLPLQTHQETRDSCSYVLANASRNKQGPKLSWHHLPSIKYPLTAQLPVERLIHNCYWQYICKVLWFPFKPKTFLSRSRYYIRPYIRFHERSCLSSIWPTIMCQ